MPTLTPGLALALSHKQEVCTYAQTRCMQKCTSLAPAHTDSQRAACNSRCVKTYNACQLGPVTITKS